MPQLGVLHTAGIVIGSITCVQRIRRFRGVCWKSSGLLSGKTGDSRSVAFWIRDGREAPNVNHQLYARSRKTGR